MNVLPFKWHNITINPIKPKSDISLRLDRKQIEFADFPRSTYIIRISKTFIIDYGLENYSPVVYIGKGQLRKRLNEHRAWLTKLQEKLTGAPIEVLFCFPQTEQGEPAHVEFEALLLRRFKNRFKSFPLHNKIHGKRVESLDFSEERTAQVLGHGTGKKYTCIIREWTKRAVQDTSS